MESDQGRIEPGVNVPPPGADRVIGDTHGFAGTVRRPGFFQGLGETMLGENVLPARNRVQWGPILAGTVTNLFLTMLLTALGLAIGASAFEPGTDLTNWGTGAGVWGIVTIIVAFFVGGWVAAKTAAVGGMFSGMMNGLIAGGLTLLFLVVLAASGVANYAGFLGANLNDISSFVQQAANGAAGTARTFNDVKNGAWGTFIGLLVAVVAAGLGGLVGYNKRAALVVGDDAAQD
ncbi:MAG TPA: hypothetical protein VFL82_16310 [Thermomicrobiales bacterium]|nr:hypothetical protein [Thermomicrobiales bacterium]